MARRNGVLQTAALLEAVGRGVRAVVQEGGGLCLCILESGFWWGGDGAMLAGVHESGLQTAFTAPTATRGPADGNGSGGGGGRALSVNINGNSNANGSGVGQDVLSRLVETMMDTVVVIHTHMEGNEEGRKASVVEVVKDERTDIDINADANADGRHGSALARWVIWQ